MFSELLDAHDLLKTQTDDAVKTSNTWIIQRKSQFNTRCGSVCKTLNYMFQWLLLLINMQMNMFHYQLSSTETSLLSYFTNEWNSCFISKLWVKNNITVARLYYVYLYNFTADCKHKLLYLLSSGRRYRALYTKTTIKHDVRKPHNTKTSTPQMINYLYYILKCTSSFNMYMSYHWQKGISARYIYCI